MSDFMPLILLLIFWFFIGKAGSAAKKGKGKNGAGGAPGKAARPGAAPARPTAQDRSLGARFVREFPHLAQQLQAAPAPEAEPRQGSLEAPPMMEPPRGHAHSELPRSGSLPVDEPEGTDPCHDDPETLRPGSLRVSVPEGTDPCHDDPETLRPGSLRVSVPEGTDPCHGGLRPVPARPDEEEETSPTPLALSWTSSDVVKGFIYGEILNRKRA